MLTMMGSFIGAATPRQFGDYITDMTMCQEDNYGNQAM